MFLSSQNHQRNTSFCSFHFPIYVNKPFYKKAKQSSTSTAQLQPLPVNHISTGILPSNIKSNPGIIAQIQSYPHRPPGCCKKQEGKKVCVVIVVSCTVRAHFLCGWLCEQSSWVASVPVSANSSRGMKRKPGRIQGECFRKKVGTRCANRSVAEEIVELEHLGKWV